jgi:general secretion pathway protein J
VTRARRQAGLTLIEVMVAMTMFAAVGALVYGGFSQTSRAKKQLEGQLDRYHEIRVTLERMARELSMAYVSVHQNPSASLQTMRTIVLGKDSGFGDRIDFTSFSHQRMFRDAKESDQNEISYFLTEAPDGEGKVIARREQARIDDRPEEGGRVEVMLEDVLEFNIEYLDPTSWQWVQSWDTSSGIGQANRLPAQVKIMITVPGITNEREREVFGTRTTLPLTWALNHAQYQ